jgi:hypothetical protein
VEIKPTVPLHPSGTIIAGFPRENYSMTHYCALWSMVFMMGFVMVFDNVHWRKKFNRLFCSKNLLSQDELNHLLTVWTACQDS